MINLLKNRRSIRKYKDLKIESEKIEALKKAALLSPSSRNLNPWEFIFVEDKNLIEKLSQSKEHGASFLKGAALAVVVIGDEKKCDVWIEDCSIASIIIQLTAESLGLGSCWIQIRERNFNSEKTSEEYIKSLLNLKDSHKVLSIISIGYPDEVRPPHVEDNLEYNKIHIK